MRDAWRRVIEMRSFWLALVVVAGALLLVSLRVEGGKEPPPEKEDAAEQAKPKSELILGYGKTEAAARGSALSLAQEWLERELRAELKPGWSVPRHVLEPDYLKEKGVIDFDK